MELGGWLMLAISWAVIGGLAALCLYRVLFDRDRR
jgi:hypothetical protein